MTFKNKLMNENPKCECGHHHCQHKEIYSHNYSAGKCNVEKCNCKHFIIETPKFNFSYKIGIEGTLTRKEADLIFLHLKHHPDTARYIEQGEFGFAFVNYFKGIDVERDFAFRDIDTMLKSLEHPIHLYNKKVDLKLKVEVIVKLTNWCKGINNEYLRIKNGKK